ncbi:MAG: hypothetical protein U0Q16_16680 [Bryobacteraceae bacterium]
MRKSIFLGFVLTAQAQKLLIGDPALCPAADHAAPIVVTDAPVSVAFHADGSCLATDDKGGTLRVWKYGTLNQRLAAPNKWKITIEKGDGDRNSFPMPLNSVVGIVLQEKDSAGKWKTYRGSSKNPIALTQPALSFTLRKATLTRQSLKEEFMVWEAYSTDPLSGDKSTKDKPAAYSAAQGLELRIAEVLVWQGLNPIPKKLTVATGKGIVTIQPE